jgi:dTDP-4-dehydrorhamnose reductase
VGWTFSKTAEDRGYEVYSGQHLLHPTHGTSVELDITDTDSVERVFHKTTPDFVVNLAAYTDVDGCEVNRKLADALNERAPRTLAKACRRFDSFLIHFSTDYVFDGVTGSYNEASETNPINYYGLTKVKGEESVRESDGRFLIVRTSTPYGYHPNRMCFPYFVYLRLSQGRTVNVAADQTTSPTRISWLAETLLKAMELRIEGLLHVAGAPATRLDVAKEIVRIFRLDERKLLTSRLDEMGWRARRPRNSSLDTSKAVRLLSSEPGSLNEGMTLFAEEISSGVRGTHVPP